MIRQLLFVGLVAVVAIAAPTTTEPPTANDPQLVIDFIEGQNLTTYQCFVQNNVKRVIVQVYVAGVAQTGAVTNGKNAAQVGIPYEFWWRPQATQATPAATQFNDGWNVIKNQGFNISRVWLFITAGDFIAADHQITAREIWPTNQTQNVAFINAFLAAAKNQGLQMGIMTNWYDWLRVTGGSSAVNTDLLWYYRAYSASTGGQTSASYDDFRPFGPFDTPQLKRVIYNRTISVCNVPVGVSYEYPLGPVIETPTPEPPPSPASGYKTAIDFAQTASVEQLECAAADNGIDTALVRIYNRGTVDNVGIQNALNAQQAGLSYELFYYPQPQFNPIAATQFTDGYNAATKAGLTFSRVWVFVTIAGEQWLIGNETQNFQFLNNFISAAKAKNIDVGIMTSWFDWLTITGYSTKVNTDLIWYYDGLADDDSGSTSPDLIDWRPFGQFVDPVCKRLSYIRPLEICNLTVAVSYCGLEPTTTAAPPSTTAAPTTLPPVETTTAAATHQPSTPAEHSHPTLPPCATTTLAPHIPANQAVDVVLEDGQILNAVQLACLRLSGVNYVFVRALANNTVPSGLGLSVLALDLAYPNANAFYAALANPQTDSTPSATEQWQTLADYASANLFQIPSPIWLWINGPIHWANDHSANVAYINEFIAAANASGVAVGIRTNWEHWNEITGNSADVNADYLWYFQGVRAFGPSGAAHQNMQDFVPFGRWSTANFKQYTLGYAENVCGGVIVNRDIYYSNYTQSAVA